MKRRDVLGLVGTAGTYLTLSGGRPLVGTARAADEYTIVSIPKVRAPWFNEFEKGMKAAAKTYGVNAYQQAPESPDEALQVSLIEDAINQGINALLVVPNDARSLVPALRKARAQGIVVISHESPQQPEANFDVEMIQNKAFGEKAMDLLHQYVGAGGGQFAVYVGSLTVPAHNLWADAALARAKAMYPNLTPVASRYPVGEDQSAAHQTALDILTAHPDLKGFVCFGSQGGPGAAQAVGERGLIGKVSVIGDTSPLQAEQYIKAGSMDAAIAWDPGEAAYAMVYLAKLVLEGKTSMITADIDIPTIGKPVSMVGNTLVYDRPLVVTKENVAQLATF